MGATTQRGEQEGGCRSSQSSPRQPTAAPTRGADERDLDSLALGAQIVASRVLALSPVDAEGDPSVAITV